NKSPEDAEIAKAIAGSDQTTGKPEITEVKGYDLNEKADTNPDKVVITGKVEGEPAGTKVSIFDKDGKKVAEVETDAEGNFTATLVEKGAKDELKEGANAEVDEINAGDTFTAKAKADSKPESEESSPKEVTKIEGGNPTDHPGDTQDPTAPTLTKTDDVGNPAEKGDGAVKVQLPTDAVAGDKAEITFTDEGEKPVKAVYEKQADGTWKLDPKASENVPENALPETVNNDDPSFVIPEEKLKDGSEVTATSTDVAGRTKDADPVKAGFDEVTATPSLTVNAIDTAEKADNTIDALVVTGNVPNEANASVGLSVKDGKTLVELGSELSADANGDYKAVLVKKGTPADVKTKLEDAYSNHKIIEVDEVPTTGSLVAKAQATENGKPSKEVSEVSPELPIPQLDNGSVDHPFDDTDPTAPTLTPTNDAGNPAEKGDGAVKVELPSDAVEGDKVEINFKDEDEKPVKAAYEKQADGTWKLDPEASKNVPSELPTTVPAPSTPNTPASFVIPEDKLLDGSEVTATSTDVAGNSTDSTPATAGFDEVTATPTLTVNAIDTATEADNTIDALVVTGTVKKDNTPENGAKVKLLHNGAEIVPTDKGLVANDEGDYKAVLVKKGTSQELKNKLKEKYPTIIEVDTLPTGELTAIAQKEGKAQSPNTDAAIPTTLANDTIDHPLDAAVPTAPRLKDFGFTDGPEKQGDVEVTFPTDAVEGDTVAVTITPPAGSADTTPKVVITFTKGKDAWTPNPALPEGYTVDGDKLHIESTSIPDGSTVSATSTDLAGKTAIGKKEGSEETSVTAAVDPRPTAKPTEVVAKATDSSTNGDTTAESVTITGKAEAGSTVTLYAADGKTVIDTKVVPAAPLGANGEIQLGEFAFTTDKLPTTDSAKDFVVKAEAPKAAPSEGTDVDVTAPGKQSDLDKVTLTGTVADYKNQELELHKDGVKVGSVTTNESGEFTFNITKGDANNATDGNVKVTDLPQTDALNSFIVKKPDGTAVAFNGTAERKTEGTQHTGDTAAPELEATLTVRLPNRPVKVDKTEPVDTKDEKANALDIKLPNSPVAQDELHVIVKTKDGEKKVVFTYENGDWKKGGDTLNVGETKPTQGADGKYSISIPATALEKGDTYTVIHRDLAGNAKVYSAAVLEQLDPTPEKVDAPVVYTGTKTTEAGNGENMLVTNFAGKDEPTKPAAVNAGDIVFRPGLDNTKLEVSFVKKDSDLASVDKARDVIYGKLEGDKFKFYKDEGYNTPVEEGLVTEITGQDGYTHYVIPADKVVDNSQFTVVGINEGGKRSDNPADVATPVTQAEYTAGFDDKTDKAVGDPAIAQADATSNITIEPTDPKPKDTDGDNSNNENNADANKVAVQFDASHLAGTSAEALGLKVNGDKGADNQIIVALKQPNGKWKLVQSDKATLDEALNTTHSDDLSEVSNGVATIDAETGKITLNKAVVNGTGGEDNKASEVKAKAKDAYGNSSTEVSHSATHADPATPMVDRPSIEDLGSGKATITLGNNNDGMVINVQGKDLTVSKQPDGKYNINPTDAAGVEFDPITGRVTVTVTGNTEVPITVKGKKDSKESEPVTAKIDPTKDATPEHTDPVDLLPLENGDVEVKPGTDNKKIRISYTAPNGTVHKDVELVKGSDGNWKPSTRAEDFTVANGKITLKASAVKDMTEVTAIGNNGNQDQQGNASAYPFVDDNSLGVTDKPWLHPSDNNMLIEKGADNHRVDVTFKPKGNSNTPETITAKLVEGGYWVLTDSNGAPVDPDVAEINPENGTVTLKGGAVEPGTTITATGHNLQTTAQGIYTPDNNRPADTASGTTEVAPLPEQPQEKPKDTGPKIIANGNEGIYINSISDSTFEIVTPDSRFDKNRIQVEFKVYDATENAIKDAVMELNRLGDYKLTVDGNIVERENGSRKKMFSGSKDGRYKLVADSPLEPPLNEPEHSNLLAKVNSYDSDGDTLLLKEHQGYLKNEVSSNPQISNETQDKEKSAQPDLEKTVGTEKGGVIIKPAADAEYLSIQYIDENGRTKYASLTKENGSWKLVGDKNDFDLSDPSNLKIKADSLRDNQQNGVSVKQRQEGKALSDAQPITPEEDYVPPVPPAPPVKSLVDTLNDIKAGQPHTNTVDRLSTGRPAAMKDMADFTKNEQGNVQGGLIIKTGYELTNDNQAVQIDGAVNYASLIPMNIDMKGGDDVLVVENQVQSTTIKLGEGNNLLAVGVANPGFDLYEDKTKHATDGRYVFANTGKTPGNGYAKVPHIENQHGANGGNIINSKVEGGNGDDVILIGGSNSNGLVSTRAAITKDSSIDLKGGNDALIIAPLTKGRAGSIEGTVNMGAGNDKLVAPEIANGGKVYMGDGNDIAQINRMDGGSSTVLDMGRGDDKVEFTAYGDTTFMDGIVNGGAGYDVFVLRKPSGDNGEQVRNVFKAAPETHLSASKLISIEEVRMEKGSAIDISADYLRKGNIPVLKLLAEGDKSAGSVGGKDARLVDLGANDLNDKSSGQSLGEFKAAGQKTEGGITYDVYTAPGTQVWIEQNGGFTII
ncbi:hypothetical protein ACWIW0_10410, partial [Ursidibacter sp. B-7004-1]